MARRIARRGGRDEAGGFAGDRVGPARPAWRRRSPLYAQELRRHPAGAAWVTHPDNEATEFRFRALRDEWQQMAADRALDPARRRCRTGSSPTRLSRKISLRIAYREVNALASAETTVGELSRLAEFACKKCLDWASAQWTVRLGVPWDEDLDRPARLGVLAWANSVAAN